MRKQSNRTIGVFACFILKERIKGFALIELMIGLMLSLLLLSILIGIYLAREQSDRVQQSLGFLQENLNLANLILRKEIHKAGYMGCPQLTSDFPIIQFPPYTITPQNKLTSASSSEITVRYAGLPATTLIQSMQENDTFYTTNEVHFASGDILMISDCYNAEILKVKQTSKLKYMQKIVSTLPLQKKFSSTAEVSRMVINKFYINHHSLYVENISHQKQELISGLDDMQILFVVQQDGELIELASHNISDWSQVVGVNIHFRFIANQIKKDGYLYIATKA